MSKRMLEAINALIFVLTILGTGAIDLFELDLGWTDKAIVAAFLVFVYMLVVREKKVEKVHSFPEKSKRFGRFFRRWYSQSGRLSIFCTDLAWLGGDSRSEIREALAKKGQNLHLYLRTYPLDPVAQTLVQGGAHHYRIKKTIRTTHRMSILDNDGIRSIIIRNKDSGSDEIVFVETDSYHDPYLISLAEDMLEDCYD